MPLKFKAICRIFFICWILVSASGLYAQKRIQRRDTLDFYKQLRKRAAQHKATLWLYDALIVDPIPRNYTSAPLSGEQLQSDLNATYEGRIIRRLIISVYNPFGYSVNDTFVRNINTIQEIGNRFHIRTRHRFIRNILLFKEGDTVELLHIRESERLLRQMRYINDARISVIGAPGDDSADVEIKVLDKWSVILTGDAGPKGGNLRIGDRNFAGTGQTLDQRLSYSLADGFAYSGNYHIANIRNTYINSDINIISAVAGSLCGLAFNRPFYSPLTRWAGGAEGTRTWSRFNYTDTATQTAQHVPLDYYNTDLWFARSFALLRNGKTDQSSNIVTGARYAGMRFLKRPSFSLDSGLVNVNTDLALGSIGYSRRKYYKDQFIYRFGANEDVPEGMLVQATMGYLQKELPGTYRYTGLEYSNGLHLKRLGYFSVSLKYGLLKNSSIESRATVNTSCYYFTDLMEKGKWYFRTFAIYKWVQLMHPSGFESLTLKQSELYGFNANGLAGRGKMVMNIESIAYAPHNLIGFKFAPIIMAGYGIIQQTGKTFGQGTVYQAYSIGLLIRNENLLNSSFEFSFGFYPTLPDQRRDIFSLNPIGSFSLKVRSFEVLRPAMVGND